MTRIVVGSVNVKKIAAVKECFESLCGEGCEVWGVDVPSGVSEQPKTQKETIQGAHNRARAAFSESDADYSVGVESGFIGGVLTPDKVLREMNVSVCCIFDGRQFAYGFSPVFEVPPEAVRITRELNMTLSQACAFMGVAKSAQIGSESGLVGVLTKGSVDRKEYMEIAIRMAAIRMMNPALYRD